jgi:hypothetical protein
MLTVTRLSPWHAGLPEPGVWGVTDFGLWSQVFHDCVGIRKVLNAVSQVRDGRVGDHRRSSRRYSSRTMQAMQDSWMGLVT